MDRRNSGAARGPGAPAVEPIDDSAAGDGALGDWKMTVEEFSFAGCHYNSSCD